MKENVLALRVSRCVPELQMFTRNAQGKLVTKARKPFNYYRNTLQMVQVLTCRRKIPVRLQGISTGNFLQ